MKQAKKFFCWYLAIWRDYLKDDRFWFITLAMVILIIFGHDSIVLLGWFAFFGAGIPLGKTNAGSEYLKRLRH